MARATTTPEAPAPLAFDGEVHVCDAVRAEAALHDPDRFFDDVSRAEAAARSRGDARPMRLLVDIRGPTQLRAKVRAAVYRRHREFDGRFVAVVGSSFVQKFLVDFLVAATGHRTTRFFVSEDAARAWLREAAA